MLYNIFRSLILHWHDFAAITTLAETRLVRHWQSRGGRCCANPSMEIDISEWSPSNYYSLYSALETIHRKWYWKSEVTQCAPSMVTRGLPVRNKTIHEMKCERQNPQPETIHDTQEFTTRRRNYTQNNCRPQSWEKFFPHNTRGRLALR